MSKSLETFLYRYRYIEDRYNTMLEHEYILDRNNDYVLWGILEDSSYGLPESLKLTENRRKKFIKELSNIEYDHGNKFCFFLSNTPDGISVLYRIYFEDIVTITSQLEWNIHKSHIPEYYHNNTNVSLFLKIKKIEQISLGYLNLYRTESGEQVLAIAKLTNKCTFLIKNIIDFPNLINLTGSRNSFISRINEFIGIYIKEYQGIENLYINFSSSKYKRDSNGNLTTICEGAYSVFSEDGINSFLCILGKNGTGKSRIIKLITNFISDWQNFKRSKTKANYDIYFKDIYGSIIKVNSNAGFIGEIQFNQNGNYSGKVSIDLSLLKCYFISNTPVDPFGIETNGIVNSIDKYSLEFSSYKYFGEMPGKRYSQTTSINLFNKNLFSILVNKSILEIFNSILKDTMGFEITHFKIDHSFFYNSKNLAEYLDLLSKYEYKSFFDGNNARKKLKELFDISSDEKVQLSFESTRSENNPGMPIITYVKKIGFNSSIHNYLQQFPLNKKFLIKPYINNNKYGNDKELEIIEQLFNLIFKSNTVTFDVYTSNGLSIKTLSAGETSLLQTILKITLAISKDKNYNILFLMDEPDIFLHPELQRRFISIITKVISNKELQRSIGRSKIGFITTTHSPIIISDIPKNNILALKKSDNGVIKEYKMSSSPFLNNLLENYASTFHIDFFVGEYAMNKFKKNQEEGFIDNQFIDSIGDKHILNFISEKKGKGKR